MEAVCMEAVVMVVHEWEHESGYIPKEYQTRIRTNLHVHVATGIVIPLLVIEPYWYICVMLW